MISYCLNCKKDPGSTNPNVSKTSNRRIMLLGKCEVCNSR